MTIFISYHIYNLVAGEVQWGSTGAVLGAATSRAGAARQTDRRVQCQGDSGDSKGVWRPGEAAAMEPSRAGEPALREGAANPGQRLRSCPGAMGTGGGLDASPHFAHCLSVCFWSGHIQSPGCEHCSWHSVGESLLPLG